MARSLALVPLVLALAALPAAAQQATFDPASLRLEQGLRATVTLRVTPPSALAQLSLSGPEQAALGWSRTGDRVTVRALTAGTFTLRARRGVAGPTLATLRVVVDAPLLDRVLERVRAEANDGDGLKPIVAFDLDDTLFDTRWRTYANLRRWGDDHGEQRLADMSVEDVRWDLEDTLRAVGLSAAEVNGPLGRAIASFMRSHYTDYELDHPFDGAVAFVRAVQAAGGQVAYVTARDDVRRAKSEAVLRAAGFPVDGTLRYFRFDSSGSIAAYKGAMVRDELPRRGEVVACFENEPANANAFRRAAPGALQGFVDSQAPPGSPSLIPGIETITTWTR